MWLGFQSRRVTDFLPSSNGSDVIENVIIAIALSPRLKSLLLFLV